MSGSNSITNIIAAISASRDTIQTEREKLSELQDHLIIMIDQLECAEADLEDATESLERAAEQLDEIPVVTKVQDQGYNAHGMSYMLKFTRGMETNKYTILASDLSAAISCGRAMQEDPHQQLEDFVFERVEWMRDGELKSCAV